MGIQFRDKAALLAPDGKFDPILGIPLQHGGSHYVVRVSVFRQFSDSLAPDSLHGSVDAPGQLRGSLGHHVPAEAGNKAGAHHSAVVVDDISIADKMVHPHYHGPPGKCRQTWSEQKKWNPAIQIKSADFGQNGEGRIVQHNLSTRVVKIFVVSVRIKGPQDGIRVDAISLAGPVFHSLVYQRRCITVIRGLFRFEFFHKRIVFRIIRKHFKLTVHFCLSTSCIDYKK